LVEVHCGGIEDMQFLVSLKDLMSSYETCEASDTCSFRIAALQVVRSLALVQFLVNDFHEFID